MRIYYILFEHMGQIGNLINRLKNLSVCSPCLWQDLARQEAKYRIYYLHNDDSGGIESSCLANYRLLHASVYCCLVLSDLSKKLAFVPVAITMTGAHKDWLFLTSGGQ